MNVEIITIGDELISGYSIDSNSKEIAKMVADIGLKVNYISSIGDDVELMEEAFRHALKRARIVITTGGLGPTDDDLTKRAIVKVFKRNLIFHEDVLEDIKARYKKRGLEMPAINQNQALLPQGAEFFQNQHGSAVGICISEQGRIFIALPGVPVEMKQIMTTEVIPYLEKLPGINPFASVTIKTTGIIESELAELIAPNLNLKPGVKLGYLPTYSGVNLRLTANAPEQNEAENLIEDLSRAIEKSCGNYIYGRNDENLEAVVGQLLLDNDKTIAVAESCSGGELGKMITSVSGSSQYFIGGITAYANETKINSLAVSPESLEKFGAVSEEVAIEMASGCRKKLQTDYALSITGIAGPEGGTDEKPIGTVYIGLASAHVTKAFKFNFGSDRNTVRIRACYRALDILRRHILDID